MTRALLLSTYVKFVNLFPEIKHNVEEIFLADSNLRSADAELQQRASEYLALAKITSLDVLATVLEEMPPFPEKVCYNFIALPVEYKLLNANLLSSPPILGEQWPVESAEEEEAWQSS